MVFKLIARRASIEKAYAKSLQQWSERWEDKLRTMGVSGSLRDGWQAVFTETRGLHDIHTQLKVGVLPREKELVKVL